MGAVHSHSSGNTPSTGAFPVFGEAEPAQRRLRGCWAGVYCCSQCGEFLQPWPHPHSRVFAHLLTEHFRVFNGLSEAQRVWRMEAPLSPTFPSLLCSVCRREPLGLQSVLNHILTGLNCPSPASFQRLPPVAGSRSCFPPKPVGFGNPVLVTVRWTQTPGTPGHSPGAAWQETKPPRI